MEKHFLLGALLRKTRSAPKKNWERTQLKLGAHPVKFSLPARWQQDYLSLEGYTVSNLGLQPGVSRLQGKISLEGYTPAKMAAGAAAPKAHAILLQRQRRSKVAQVASPLWGRGMFFCSRHTLQGAFLFFLFSATRGSPTTKSRMKTAFLHIPAQLYIYIFCFPMTLHTSPQNPTQ